MPDQAPIPIALQCHKCQKRLRYTGKKSVVTCPGCGESVPVVDNIQEGASIVLPPPIQTLPPSIQVSHVTNKPEDWINDWVKKWKPKAMETIDKVKKMPRFPVVLTGIWLLWVALGFFLFSIGMVNYQELNSAGVIGYGRFFTYSGWFVLHAGDSIYMSIWTTSFPAIVLSVIAYFWIAQSSRDAAKP